MQGGDAVQVTFGGGFRPLESRDGAYIHYRRAPNSSDLWRIPTSGGPPINLLERGCEHFSVVDKGIYCLEETSRDAALRFLDLSSSRSSIVARGLGRTPYLFTASRDGRTILYSRIDSAVEDLMLVENFK